MTTLTVDLRDLDRLYAAWGRQVPFAVSRALNDTAFKMKSDLEKRSTSDLTMRRNPRQALGIGITKAAKAKLEAEVKSLRGWLAHQVEAGIATPKTGITWKGQQYLLIPAKDMKTASGKLKKLKGGATFIVRSKRTGEVVLMARRGQNIRPIGALVKQAQHADDLGWDEQSEQTFKREFGQAFNLRMERALATAR